MANTCWDQECYQSQHLEVYSFVLLLLVEYLDEFLEMRSLDFVSFALVLVAYDF